MARNDEAYRRKKGRILDTAWELFREKGYDGTTVDAVIDRAGISKGTFYHYFDSKADLLDGVVERLTLQGFEELRPILAQRSIPPLERLDRLLAASRDWRIANLDRIRTVLEVLLRDENTIIRNKMNRLMASLIVPHLAEIIAQGVKNGSFQVDHPRETAEILISLVQVTAELNAWDLLRLEEYPERFGSMEKRIGIYLESLRRILAAPQGAFQGLEAGFAERIAAVFNDGPGNSREEGRGQG